MHLIKTATGESLHHTLSSVKNFVCDSKIHGYWFDWASTAV